MSIKQNDLIMAQRIFNSLLKKGELEEKSNKELYQYYISDEGVREALEIIQRESKVRIKHTNGIIYLIPDMDNEIFRFNINECTNKSLLGEKQENVYLSYLIMSVIFAEFTNQLAPASYIEIPSILSLVDDSLNRSTSKENIYQEEVKAAFNVKRCKDIWDAKPKWNEHDKKGIFTRKSDYQIGCIRRIIVFLQNQNLVKVISDEDKIVPSRRLMDLMNVYFLDEDRKSEIEELLCLNGDVENA